ncbi:MAG: hypothetical protein ACOX6U_04790 [Oscillospiraceae bacterium]|jgi:hypothetical protein
MKPKGLALATALLLLLPSCMFGPGTQDWKLPLSNQYEMWRINSEEIVIGRADGNGGLETVIEPKVTQYFTSGSYVAAVQQDSGAETGQPSYYLLNTADGALAGPFSSEQELIDYGRTLGLSPQEWIATTPAPDGAVYE